MNKTGLVERKKDLLKVVAEFIICSVLYITYVDPIYYFLQNLGAKGSHFTGRFKFTIVFFFPLIITISIMTCVRFGLVNGICT